MSSFQHTPLAALAAIAPSSYAVHYRLHGNETQTRTVNPVYGISSLGKAPVLRRMNPQLTVAKNEIDLRGLPTIRISDPWPVAAARIRKFVSDGFRGAFLLVNRANVFVLLTGVDAGVIARSATRYHAAKKVQKFVAA